MLCFWCVGDTALHIHTNVHHNTMATMLLTLGSYRYIHLAYLSPEVICCLQTCFVYGVLLTLFHSHVLTSASYRYV